MRNYQTELEQRTGFIKNILEQAGCEGIVFGNSGGKDSALVGILCKKACDAVYGVRMPCQSSSNYGDDLRDADELAEKFGIKTLTVDLSSAKSSICGEIEKSVPASDAAKANIAPRLRMSALYCVAQSLNCLVAGTGNRSEIYVGYFTKWGDGGYDFNPIADLTVSEVYEFLEFLGAPANIIKKAPSAGLYEGQTDEGEMGLKYADLDRYLLTGEAEPVIMNKIESYHKRSAHKMKPPARYGER